MGRSQSVAGTCSGSASGGSAGAPTRVQLLDLPDDALSAICALALHDLPALRLTCTALLGPANCAAQRLCLRHAATGAQLARFPCVKEVVVEDWSEGWADSWLLELAQVRLSAHSRVLPAQCLAPTV